MHSAHGGLIRAIAFIALFTAFAGTASADYVLTAPPRESPAQGAATYGPLAARLSELLGTPVIYRHPETWPKYTSAMRDDAYDLVFDGPHFVSWRMAHIGHQVLVQLPGSLVFHIVVRADDAAIEKVADLAGEKICGIAPPNLGTLAVIKQFPNPARQPVIVPVRGGFQGVYKAFADGRCRAAVLRTQFYDKKLDDAQRAAVRIVTTSSPLPNQALSASSRVSDEHKARIVAALTGEDAVAAKPIFERFAREATAFEASDPARFQGHNLLLEGVIWGW